MTAEEALAKGIEPALVWLGGDDDGRDTDEDYVKNKYKIRGIDIEPDSPTGNTNRRKHGKFAHRIKYRRRRYPRSERPNIAVLFPIGKWPVVDFLTPSGSKRTVICVPNDFTVDNAQGRMEAAREQVPLILAWALSVHKCQGKTLNRVKVDLKKIFENGQGEHKIHCQAKKKKKSTCSRSTPPHFYSVCCTFKGNNDGASPSG